MTTLGELVLAGAATQPDRVLLSYATDAWPDLTGGDLVERVSAMNAPLTASVDGDRPQRWALDLSEGPDVLALLLAAWQRREPIVLLDRLWGSATRDAVLQHSRATAVIAVGPEGPVVTGRRAVGSTPPLSPDVAFIAYTSGSTSDPKGVILGHRQLVAAYTASATALPAVAGRPARFGCCLRISGLGVLGMCFLWPLVAGLEVSVLPELTMASARGFWAEVDRAEVDLLYVVPAVVELLDRMAVGRPERPVTAISGGAPLSPTTQATFHERFGVPLLNAYGLTEVAFAAFLGHRPDDGWPTPAIGSPVTVDARLVDEHGSLVVGPGRGELELSGPVVMDGYYDNESATSATVVNGWVRTGDLAERDATGAYRIVGRIKDVVLKGGFTIYLAEVEEVAAGLPGVVEAVAVGYETATGEELGLIVRTELGGELDTGALRAQLQSALGAHRAPRRVVVIDDEPIPRVAQGKVDRRRVQAWWPEIAARDSAR